MSLVEQFDGGSRTRARTALGNTSLTQSSAAAPTSSTGLTIDRQETGLRHYYSAKAVVSGLFTAGSSEQVATLSINVQHSSDGTSWDSFSTATKPDAVTFGTTAGANGTTGGTEDNTVEQRVNLLTARRYIRVTLDAPSYANCSSGHRLDVHGVLEFSGPDELPAQ